jgi:hypothetical protein
MRPQLVSWRRRFGGAKAIQSDRAQARQEKISCEWESSDQLAGLVLQLARFSDPILVVERAVANRLIY